MFRVFFFFFFCFAKGKEGQSCSPHCEVTNAYHIVKLVHDIIFLLLLWLLDLLRSLTKKNVCSSFQYRNNERKNQRAPYLLLLLLLHVSEHLRVELILGEKRAEKCEEIGHTQKKKKI